MVEASQPTTFPPAAPEPPAAEPDPAPVKAPEHLPESIDLLEQRFKASRSTEEATELVTQIAGWNNAEAVNAIARLFPLSRHPDIKVALLSGLADIDVRSAPEARLAVFALALGKEPRNVRSAAVTALADFEDPRAMPLLQRAMRDDPDHAVRDSAAALYHARKEDAEQ